MFDVRYYLQEQLTTFVELVALNLSRVKLFRIRGAAFVKAIVLADKNLWHVLLLRKQVNCSLPGTISTSLIIKLKLFHFLVQIADHDPAGRDEC